MPSKPRLQDHHDPALERADKKLTRQERADLAFRYLDWLLTKNVPSGGFPLLYAVLQRLNEENQFHCYPSIDYLAARIQRKPRRGDGCASRSPDARSHAACGGLRTAPDKIWS